MVLFRRGKQARSQSLRTDLDRNEDGKVELLGPTSEITQQNDYYPFGLRQEGDELLFHGEMGTNRYRYNGKEFNEDIGLYDYGARWYDPSIGRWGAIDPLSDGYTPFSPYNYTLNNPIRYVDPDGMRVDVSDYINNGDTKGLIDIMANVAEITGQIISFESTSEGSFLTGDEDCNSSCPSSEAAQYVDYLINDTSGTIKLANNDRNKHVDSKGNANRLKGSQAYRNGEVYLDDDQIENFVSSINDAGLDGETMNSGMVFLHETLHTNFGAAFFRKRNPKNKGAGGYSDPPRGFAQTAMPGDVVDVINRFRNDVGLPERTSYTSPASGNLRIADRNISLK